MRDRLISYYFICVVTKTSGQDYECTITLKNELGNNVNDKLSSLCSIITVSEPVFAGHWSNGSRAFP